MSYCIGLFNNNSSVFLSNLFSFITWIEKYIQTQTNQMSSY